jgi:hypothetical protein
MVGGLLLSILNEEMKGQTELAGDPPSVLGGIYRVEEQLRNHAAVPAADPKGWRQAVFARSGKYLSVRGLNDSLMHFKVADDPASQKLTLTQQNDKQPLATLSYRRPDEQQIILDGVFDDQPVTIRLRKDESKLLLIHRGFHWINEAPFNR